MQVILTKDLAKTGRKGEMITVARGYFRNYLFPRQLAKIASPKLIEHAAKIGEIIAKEKEEMIRSATELKLKLEEALLHLKEKVTKKGTLYAKVSNKEIVDALKKDLKITLTQDQILLKKPIKETGDHLVDIRLADGVFTKLRVKIESDKEE